jgi:hypothetical protein
MVWQQARDALDNKGCVEPRRMFEPIGDGLEKCDGAYVWRKFVEYPENLERRTPNSILATIQQANE